MLKTNAINAINALLEAQLMVVSRESGIDISILQKYVGDAPVIQEKKKRAPPKKKVPVEVPVIEAVIPAIVTEMPPIEVSHIEVPVTIEVPEKKKRAPPKKKVLEPVTEVPAIEVTVVEEKKKRAPPKKKVQAPEVPAIVMEVPAIVMEVPAVEEKKKRAPPKKKVAEPVAQNDDVPKKRAPAKKKTEEPANMCYICKNTKDLQTTGNSDGYVCQHCVDNSDGQAFCKTCNRYEETDGDGYCGKCQDLQEIATVKLDDSSSDSDSSDDELPIDDDM